MYVYLVIYDCGADMHVWWLFTESGVHLTYLCVQSCVLQVLVHSEALYNTVVTMKKQLLYHIHPQAFIYLLTLLITQEKHNCNVNAVICYPFVLSDTDE